MNPPPRQACVLDLDPRRLLTFRTVVRAGSLGAAARALGWTQRAVSQQVRALERQVGVPLAVALLPRTALDVVVRRVEDGGRRRVDLVHHRDAAGGPALQALVEALVEVSGTAAPPAGRPPG